MPPSAGPQPRQRPHAGRSGRAVVVSVDLPFQEACGDRLNPSGGLISKGHPLGATGLAQCAELTWQLRGTADKRQVDDVTAALQHNIGLGGAAVVTAYQRAER